MLVERQKATSNILKTHSSWMSDMNHVPWIQPSTTHLTLPSKFKTPVTVSAHFQYKEKKPIPGIQVVRVQQDNSTQQTGGKAQ